MGMDRRDRCVGFLPSACIQLLGCMSASLHSFRVSERRPPLFLSLSFFINHSSYPGTNPDIRITFKRMTESRQALQIDDAREHELHFMTDNRACAWTRYSDSFELSDG